MFDIGEFIGSNDTLYIVGSGFDQRAVAPAITSFVGAIARATYDTWQRGDARVLFALDEVANIAPLPTLPSIMSEGGGQGLKVLVTFQDLSQAFSRWPIESSGFLTLARNIVLLRGIREASTLATLAAMCSASTRSTLNRRTRLAPSLRPISVPSTSAHRTVVHQRSRSPRATGQCSRFPPPSTLQYFCRRSFRRPAELDELDCPKTVSDVR